MSVDHLAVLLKRAFPSHWEEELPHVVRMWVKSGLTVVIDDESGDVTFLEGMSTPVSPPSHGRVVILPPPV